MPLLVPLVAAVKHHGADEADKAACALELEARLGRYDTTTGRFEAGLYGLYFHNVVGALDGCQQWASVTDWEEVVDTFHTLPNGQAARTSMSGAGAHTVTKTRVASQQLLCMGTLAATNSQSGLDVRITLSREQAVPAPFSALPSLVRLKQRRSYLAANWRFDVSRTWSGASRSAAEAAQMAEGPVYEVELEFTPTPAYLGEDTDHIARSMLHKLWNLLHPLGQDSTMVYMGLQDYLQKYRQADLDKPQNGGA